MPVALVLTLPLGVTATLPAQASLAVAPGSVKLPVHSTFVVEGPTNVTTGGVVSATVKLTTLLVALPALAAAVMTVPIGALTDRVRRVSLLKWSVVVWSLAMTAAGAGPHFRCCW